MWDLKCGTFRNVKNRNRLTDIKKRLVVAKQEAEGVGWMGNLGSAGAKLLP